VRLALLDADVALSVVKTFTEAVKHERLALKSQEPDPGQAFIKSCMRN